MKRNVLCLSAIAALVAVLFAGCGGPGSTGPASGGGNTQPVPSRTAAEANAQPVPSRTAEEAPAAIQPTAGDRSAITSLQAAELAYKEAVTWRPDAVLWSLTAGPYTLDENWTSNDLARDWTVLFASRSDDKIFTVEIEGGKVVQSAEESYTVRKIDIPESAPADRPRVSMKDAAKAAIQNGMPEHPTDAIVYYTIEDYTQEFNGKPTWQMTFAAWDTHYCSVVDGLTGKFITVLGMDGKPADLSSRPIEVEPPVGDPRETMNAFFALLDEGKSEEALGLMVGARKQNAENVAMWKASFDGIESIALTNTEEFLKENWTNSYRYYKCALSVALKPDAQPGLWEDGQITRYVGVQSENGQWKIAEISMNP